MALGGIMSLIIVNDAAAKETRDQGHQQADFKADLTRQAAEAIEQAGNGLVAAHQSCLANTADGKTIYTLLVVQGFVTDALARLTEKEFSTIIAV